MRRPPPAFVVCRVVSVEQRTPRLAMVTLEGAGIAALVPPEPAASVRLLTPRGHAADELEMPVYDGNIFRYLDGELSTARTMTPLSAGRAQRVLLGVHDHGGGRLSTWLGQVEPGDSVALSGPGAGYTVDGDAGRFVIAGDESALPAISQLLGALPGHADVDVAIEVGAVEARTELPAHPRSEITWLDAAPAAAPGEAMVEWIGRRAIDAATRVWAAGEAAAVHQIRKVLDGAGVQRSQMSVRGYWKRRG